MNVFDRVTAGAGGCWLWTGAVSSTGYGSVGIAGRTHNAHRVAYESATGPIPAGLQLDHLCRVRRCIRPDHLEPVTPGENTRRGYRAQVTECPNGHPYDEANTYRKPGGGRVCRRCRNATSERARSSRRGTDRLRAAGNPLTATYCPDLKEPRP